MDQNKQKSVFWPDGSQIQKYCKAEYVQRRLCLINVQLSLHENVIFSVRACRIFYFYHVKFQLWCGCQGESSSKIKSGNFLRGGGKIFLGNLDSCASASCLHLPAKTISYSPPPKTIPSFLTSLKLPLTNKKHPLVIALLKVSLP